MTDNAINLGNGRPFLPWPEQESIYWVGQWWCTLAYDITNSGGLDFLTDDQIEWLDRMEMTDYPPTAAEVETLYAMQRILRNAGAGCAWWTT